MGLKFRVDFVDQLWKVLEFRGVDQDPQEWVVATFRYEDDAKDFAAMMNKAKIPEQTKNEYFESEAFFQDYKKFAVVNEPEARTKLQRLVKIVRNVCP